MKRLMPTLSALAFALAAASAHAIPLSNLLNGDSIQAGDKLFDDWELVHHLSGDGRIFEAANIEVTALNDGGLDPGPGLRFTASNDELSVTGDGIFNFVDLQFGFHVTVDPGLRIKDNSLAITGAILINFTEDHGVTILEWVGNDIVSDPATLGFISTEFSNLGGAQTKSLTAGSTFAPASDIWVTKNILVWATNTEETASLTEFTQRYSQTTVTVPEPATLALMGLGLAGLGAMRRRKA